MDVFFAGSAWTEAQRQAVLRELRTELGRRALQVCHRTLLPASPSANELTLVAIGPDEVRIMPARLNGESAWEGGRTMRLARLPEDARPLAIALAADEALRGRPRRDPPKPAVQTPAPKPLRAAPTTRPHLDIGATVRVALLTGAGPRIIPLTPGASLRAGLTRAGWGGSVGTVLSPSTKWTFDSNDFQQLRLPFDLSATKTFPAGPFNAMLEAGVVLAFLHLEYSGTGKTLEQFEAGGRLGFSLSWGRRTLVPLLGASLEVMPTAHDLRLTPVGSVGHTAQLWAGITIGLEARFE